MHRPSRRSRWISLRQSLLSTARRVIGTPEPEGLVPAYDSDLPKGTSSYGPTKRSHDRP